MKKVIYSAIIGIILVSGLSYGGNISQEELIQKDMELENNGKIAYQNGDYELSSKYWEECLNLRIDNLGENHIKTAIMYNNLSVIYIEIKNYDKALKYAKKALDILEKIPEEENELIAIYLAIATIYDDIKNYEEALIYSKKALRIIKKNLGENSPYTASAYNSLGLIYYHKKEYQKALKYFKKSLEIDLKVYGEQHMNTATDYNNIGLSYRDMAIEYDNNLDLQKVPELIKKALANLKKSLEIRERILGKKHPHTIQSYSDIGLLYEYFNNKELALRYYQKANGF